MNGEDILFAMTSLGFENYSEALKIYLSKYREVSLTYHDTRSLYSEDLGVSSSFLTAISDQQDRESAKPAR